MEGLLSIWFHLDSLKGWEKKDEEIILLNIQLFDFTREVTKVKGIFVADLTVGSKTSRTTFCVVEAYRLYNLLLERDWIHRN